MGKSAGWPPNSFAFEVLGCEHTLKIPSVKLLDYAGREAELQANENPFVLVTLAHLLTQATRQDMGACYAAKWKLNPVALPAWRGQATHHRPISGDRLDAATPRAPEVGVVAEYSSP
jgi:hypothetical protein